MNRETMTTRLHTIPYLAPGSAHSCGRPYPSVLTLDVYEAPTRAATDGQRCAGRIWLHVIAAEVAVWDATKQAQRQQDLPVDTDSYMFTHGTETYRAAVRAALAAIAAVRSGASAVAPVHVREEVPWGHVRCADGRIRSMIPGPGERSEFAVYCDTLAHDGLPEY